MYLLSNSFSIFAPPDLSGVVVFDKYDYSTIFIQTDLSQYPQIVNSSGSLNLNLFNSLGDSDPTISSFRGELMNKKIMLESD